MKGIKWHKRKAFLKSILGKILDNAVGIMYGAIFLIVIYGTVVIWIMK